MYYCQQQIIATWTNMSNHTLCDDAIRQMNPIFGSNPLQLNAMRVIDDQSNIYATKAFLGVTITLLPTPVVITPALSLRII